MRYVVRLVHDLATKGCVDQKMTVPGMMVGETVLLTPDVHNKVLSACLLIPSCAEADSDLGFPNG